jgi:hypothetical protein
MCSRSRYYRPQKQVGNIDDVLTRRIAQSVDMTSLQEGKVAERFLDDVDEDSFNEVFRVFSPQMVAFFRRRGHEKSVAEDLAQEC